jgi:NADPH:quinone reductase-like Zn-dependent oxidoreductase
MANDFNAVRFHEYGDAGKLVLESVPRPALKGNEVLVEVYFAGVNPIDWKIRAGYMKAFMPVPLPYTPGIDFSGVVADVGPEVKNLKKGQAVFGVANGSYAQFALSSADDAIPKPDGLSFELAATVPVGALTAWKAIDDAGLKSGQTVLILGAAGGVGMFAVQFARLKGAKVIGTASVENAAYVKALGAEKVVDYKSGALASEVKDVDVVLDFVGGDALESAYGLAKKGGVLVSVAGQVSEAKASEHGIKALYSGRGPTNLLVHIAELLAKKSVRSEVGRVFPLAEAKAAQELSETRHGRGRILLKVK